ncbi:hypothetical protein ACQKLP_10820 [Chitinophaga sp. NPDC101104]|uniref:hypothetical protein n=1 Tax=Chitinophaga sp. NPDC101104 TaxID=3390561 RepID=UPI003CFCD21F
MQNLMNYLDIIYDPVKVYVLMQPNSDQVLPYVETYRLHNRRATAAHPLSLDEAQQLAEILNSVSPDSGDCFQPTGLIPANALYTRAGKTGFAIWYTPARRVNLLFTEELDIADGIASVPPLLWKADRTSLQIFALLFNQRPNINTRLLRSPFHNTDKDGFVCMGSAKIDGDSIENLEGFMASWESAFFQSVFTHAGDNTESPVNGDMNAMWRKLIATQQPFPKKMLKKTSITLKALL